MSLSDDIPEAVEKVFREAWSERVGKVVPDPSSLLLGNDAVILHGTILYADMSGSTYLVDNHPAQFAAEIYKAYLASSAHIIKENDGVITAYDGDRIMAVFIGDSKNTNASKSAFNIAWSVNQVINPAIKLQYPSTTYQMNYSIGIDTSQVLVSRVGVKNDNDLVWVGRAANYAAKLSDLEAGAIYITRQVFDQLHESCKYYGNPSESMWDTRTWTAMNLFVYRSTWWLKPS